MRRAVDARGLEADRRHLHLFRFTILFWAAYEQKGASLNIFALKLVRTEIGGFRFPSSWLQSLTPFFVIVLAPVFSVLWVRMGRRQPSSPVKFTLGLLFIGLAYVLLVPGAALTAYGKISPLWLVGLYFLEVVGEMCLSPVGLSTVTKLAPARLVGIMMGVWFLGAALGNKLAGYLSGFFVPDSGHARQALRRNRDRPSGRDRHPRDADAESGKADGHGTVAPAAQARTGAQAWHAADSELHSRETKRRQDTLRRTPAVVRATTFGKPRRRRGRTLRPCCGGPPRGPSPPRRRARRRSRARPG